MKSFGADLGIAICGLVASILVVIANVAISNITGFNLFTFNIWFIIPAGAIAVGAAAASGYYFGALFFHKRPSAVLLLQMVAIAAIAQFSIYYLEYATMVVDGEKISDYVPFEQYLDIVLTKSHYRMGRAGTVDTGEIGSAGYWIAAIQFLGFLLGGISIYFILLTKPVCDKCKAYFRPLAKKIKTFEDADSCSAYYDVLFTHPVDSDEFADLIMQDQKVEKIERGAITVQTALNGCPSCKTQLIIDNVSIYNGNDWKDISDLDRRVLIPEGINLKPIFRA
jgi:hypothetical protein